MPVVHSKLREVLQEALQEALQKAQHVQEVDPSAVRTVEAFPSVRLHLGASAVDSSLVLVDTAVVVASAFRSHHKVACYIQG